MSSVFSTLHESLQQVLAQRLEWTELREVQERTYSAVATGSDVLVIAPTAGGKSEAALIPVMDDILKNGRMGVTCLYISPLKALINDQEDRFRAFCIPTSLSVMKWHSDVPKGDRSWKDGEPPHFLMITPESLEVLLQEKKLSSDLRRVRTIIIDELHAFVESERGVHLKVLLDRMDRIIKRPVQRIGLSATAGNPKEVLAWLSDGRHTAKLVWVSSPPKEKQFLFIVEPEEKDRINALVRIVDGKKALDAVIVNGFEITDPRGGVDPATGQPLMRKVVKVYPSDNIQMFADVAKEYIRSDEFNAMPLDRQDAVDQYYEYLLGLLTPAAALPPPGQPGSGQAPPPRLSLPPGAPAQPKMPGQVSLPAATAAARAGDKAEGAQGPS